MGYIKSSVVCVMHLLSQIWIDENGKEIAFEINSSKDYLIDKCVPTPI